MLAFHFISIIYEDISTCTTRGSFLGREAAYTCLPHFFFALADPDYHWRAAALRSLGRLQRYYFHHLGYNLFLNGSNNDHISVNQKYNITEKQYGTSYNFISTKIRSNSRFVGLIANGDYSGIALGVSDPTDGVTVQDYIEV